MKKLLIIVVSLGLVIGASAQRFGGHSVGGYYGGPRVVVGVGAYAPFYSPFYYPYYPWGYYGGGYGNRSSQLDIQIRDIKNEYSDRIWSVKNDKSLSGKQRRHQVHLLKQERDRDIENAKLNYYKRN
jgi:hypothetical protein